MITVKIIYRFSNWCFFVAEYEGNVYPIADWNEISIAKDFLYLTPFFQNFSGWPSRKVKNRRGLRISDNKAKKGTKVPIWLILAKYKPDLLIKGEIENGIFYEFTECNSCKKWHRIKIYNCPYCGIINPLMKHIKPPRPKAK